MLTCEKCGEKHSAELSEKICEDCSGKVHDATANSIANVELKQKSDCAVGIAPKQNTFEAGNEDSDQCPDCQYCGLGYATAGNLCAQCDEELHGEDKCQVCGCPVDMPGNVCSHCADIDDDEPVKPGMCACCGEKEAVIADLCQTCSDEMDEDSKCHACGQVDELVQGLCPSCEAMICKQIPDSVNEAPCQVCGEMTVVTKRHGNKCYDCRQGSSVKKVLKSVDQKLDITPARSLIWVTFAGAYAHRDPDTFVVQNDVRVCCEYADAMMLEFDKRFKDAK